MYFNGTQTQTLPRRSLVTSFFRRASFFCTPTWGYYIWVMIIPAAIGAITFLPSLGLNIALALGAPLGMFAMGGKYRVIPKGLRPAFVMPIIMQFVAMWFLLTAGHVLPETLCTILPNIITIIFTFFFACYMTFYMATLFFSISPKEKWVMGPLAVVTAICYWVTATYAVIG